PPLQTGRADFPHPAYLDSLTPRHAPEDPAWPRGQIPAHSGGVNTVVGFPQAVLPYSSETESPAGALRSAGVTRFPHSYDPPRLPTGPTGGYGFPLPVAPRSYPDPRPPGRVSQVPASICRRPPSRITPEDPTAAFARCFAADARLHPIWRDGHPRLCN